MLFLGLGARLDQSERLLPYLPFWFDELIILPLPFLSDIIIDAHRTHPDQARDAINYLTNSTNQQTTAAWAMAGITFDCLDQVQSLDDIVTILDRLDWIPSPPPAQLGKVFPAFQAIALDVRQAQNATSIDNQADFLKAPIEKLHRLQTQLAYERANIATNFGSITHRWLDLLETAQQTLESQRQTLPQVYLAGSALDPNLAQTRFKGRKDLFAKIEALSLAEQPPVLLLYGGRRTGKTSSLKYLPQRVGSDLVPLFVDIQGIANATTLAGVAQSLTVQIREAARKARQLSLPDLPPDFHRDPFVALQTWFASIEKKVRGKRFLLCLDEFERFSEIINTTGSRVPLNFFRNLIQHHPRWIVLFSGSHHPDELDTYWSDYLINTRALRLSYLDREAAIELIREPVPDFPDIYPDAVVEAILHLTRAQPYHIQLICMTVVERLNAEKRRLVTLEDIETCIPTALETAWGVFNELWKETLDENERDFLLALLAGEPITATPKTTIRRLIHKEVIEKCETGYRIQVPLVQRYLESKAQEY